MGFIYAEGDTNRGLKYQHKLVILVNYLLVQQERGSVEPYSGCTISHFTNMWLCRAVFLVQYIARAIKRIIIAY